MNRQDVNREAQQMLGVVPGFLNAVPDEHVGALWENMRLIQLSPGKISAKNQQLIMLGVSVYSKCKYCTEFHTEVAKALGATKDEITEVGLLVGHTAQWSNFLGAIQYDFVQFKREEKTACNTLMSSKNGPQAGTQKQPPARS